MSINFPPAIHSFIIMTFEVSKIFVLSTIHVPGDKRCQLDSHGVDTDSGWFISTASLEELVTDFSWIMPVLHFVHQEKAQYVLFDSDAPTYPQLMRYEW